MKLSFFLQKGPEQFACDFSDHVHTILAMMSQKSCITTKFLCIHYKLSDCSTIQCCWLKDAAMTHYLLNATSTFACCCNCIGSAKEGNVILTHIWFWLAIDMFQHWIPLFLGCWTCRGVAVKDSTYHMLLHKLYLQKQRKPKQYR